MVNKLERDSLGPALSPQCQARTDSTRSGSPSIYPRIMSLRPRALPASFCAVPPQRSSSPLGGAERCYKVKLFAACPFIVYHRAALESDIRKMRRHHQTSRLIPLRDRDTLTLVFVCITILCIAVALLLLFS